MKGWRIILLFVAGYLVISGLAPKGSEGPCFAGICYRNGHWLSR